MTIRPHCERALPPSLYGKVKDPQSSPRWSFCPGVHHTSRKRELLDLAWKGSDHIRRRSPWKHACHIHTPQKLGFRSQPRRRYLQVGHGEQRQQGEGHQVEQSRLCSAVDPGGHGGGQQACAQSQHSSKHRRAHANPNTPNLRLHFHSPTKYPIRVQWK